MKNVIWRTSVAAAISVTLVLGTPSLANSYRESGKLVDLGKSGMSVVPPRDWNKLTLEPGKYAETWTLDGEQLNDVTFYSGVESGKPLVRERDKKRDPLPKYSDKMLLIELPELLEGTYRAYKKISGFRLASSSPGQFLRQKGVLFSYEYTDEDNLPRRGEARATIIAKKLYMVTFDAPRLHYFDKTVSDYRALADATSIKGR